MLCQWCHLVARSTAQRLRLRAVRPQSFHTGTYAHGPASASSAVLAGPVQQTPGSRRPGQPVGPGRRHAGTQSQRRGVATGPGLGPHRHWSTRSGRGEDCGRRWMSNDSGRGDQDGTPPGGQYRSPWTILKEEFKVPKYRSA